MPKIIPAQESDIPEIHRFICALATYEKLAHEVVASVDDLRETLFRKCFAEVILLEESPGKRVGFAIFFHNYSTFLGKPGIYLEDLFVLPESRGKGYGKKLLGHLAKLAMERNCGRLEWAVLDWNSPAIEFYRSLGAVPKSDWIINRLTGEALEKVASLE